MTIRDWYGGLVFLLAALVVAGGAIGLGVGTLERPGPGLAPLLFATVLGLLSAILVLRARRAAPVRVEIRWLQVAALLAVLLAWGLAVQTTGYLAATFLATLGLVLIGGRPWYAALAFAAGATLVVEFVFVRWLGTPLPRGTLFL